MSANLHGEWDAYQELDRLGDPWAALNLMVDFEAFRDILEDCWRPADAEPRKGGWPPYDAVLMFKLLLVGRKCGLSDEKLEVLAHDSRRIMRFLGVTMGDLLPDRATIARYRAQLDLNTMHELLEALNAQLAATRYAVRDGQMVDSSFTLVPIQRNTRDENATLNQGDVPAKWQEDKATAKLRQKDVDARWTKKHGKSFFGDKNHVCVDVGWKLIRGYVSTPANVRDINVLEDLIDQPQPRQPLYADAAYRAKVRARVEHVFGMLETAIGGKRMRCNDIDSDRFAEPPLQRYVDQLASNVVPGGCTDELNRRS